MRVLLLDQARVSRVVGKKITKAPAIHMQYALCLVRGVCVCKCVCVPV